VHLDFDAPLTLTAEGLLTEAEAEALIARIDAANPTVAPITTAQGPVMDTDLRNNERVIFDDPALAAWLMERLRPHAPATCHGFQLVGLNERLRCYRYRPGMRFAPHFDGAFIRPDDGPERAPPGTPRVIERSFYSVLFYLNAVEEGGETNFLAGPDLRVIPRAGSVLMFQHRLLHEGAEVRRGAKYVARSDLMYRGVPRGR
jgi:prolyl 4-hydroxylase